MSDVDLLLRAYYEGLYERLEAKMAILEKRIEELLTEEISKRRIEGFDGDKYTAYRDACLAFVAERMESYNPIGIQYLYDRARAWDAFELELQLNWYDSRAEFEDLVEIAHAKVEAEMTEQRVRLLAEEMIKEAGAFPDRSIISAYQAKPALLNMPDYIVACAIEEIIRTTARPSP